MENEETVTEKKNYGKCGFKYGVYRFFKRTFDIIASGMFILLFSWLYLIIALIVKCGDKDTQVPQYEKERGQTRRNAHARTVGAV